MTTTPFPVTIIYTLDTETRERRFRAAVSLRDDQPATDAFDEAMERLEARHPGREINFLYEL